VHETFAVGVLAHPEHFETLGKNLFNDPDIVKNLECSRMQAVAWQ